MRALPLGAAQQPCTQPNRTATSCAGHGASSGAVRACTLCTAAGSCRRSLARRSAAPVVACCREHSFAFCSSSQQQLPRLPRAARRRGSLVARHSSCCGPTYADDEHEHAHEHEQEHAHAHEHEHVHLHDHHHHHHEDDHDHDHGHHGHHHHHHHASRSGPLGRALSWVFGITGLTSLAQALEASRAATLAMVACFALALAATMAASAGGLAPAAAAATERLAHAATLGVFFFAGLPECVELCYAVAGGHVDTHVLMTLAALGSYFMGAPLEGALLLVLFRGSHAMEEALTRRARGNLAALLDATPSTAAVVELDEGGAPRMDTLRTLRAADVAVGSAVVVRPGEQVPLDGAVLRGRALVSAEHITGESLPLLRGRGDQVPAGAANLDGVLVLRTLAAASDSTPARITRLARSAQAQRPRLRRWIDSFGAWYSKAVVLGTLAALAAMLAAGVPLLSDGGQRGALYRAMGVLTVASPCALVMVPLAYVSAIAAAAQRGVLLRSAAVLDALAGCTTVAFDKTGTLTSGSLACTALCDPAAGACAGPAAVPDQPPVGADRDAVAAAVALSRLSTHPVARAVTELGQRWAGHLPVLDVRDFRLEAGSGVEGVVEVEGQQHAVCFGSAEWVKARLAPDQAALLQEAVDAASRSGALSTLCMQPAAGDTSVAPLLRVFVFEDTIRARSAAAVRVLQQGLVDGQPKGTSIRLLILTGDNAASAAAVGGALGITDVRSGLTPEQKLAAVKALRSDGAEGQRGGVLMVGDGINDTPALAAADVGMAVSAAAGDAVASAADVLLLGTEPIGAIPALLAMSYRTKAIVRQNLVLAAGSVLALLLPTVSGLVPLWLAVALHEGTTVAVALNSLRLLRAVGAHKDLAQGGGAGGTQGAAKAVAASKGAAMPENGTGELLAANGSGKGELVTVPPAA